LRTVHLAEGLLVADNLFLLHPPPTHPRTEPSRPDLGWRARAVPPNMDFYCANHFHEVLTTRRYRLSINRGPSGFVRHASVDRETSDVSELDFRTVSETSCASRREHTSDERCSCRRSDVKNSHAGA